MSVAKASRNLFEGRGENQKSRRVLETTLPMYPSESLLSIDTYYIKILTNNTILLFLLSLFVVAKYIMHTPFYGAMLASSCSIDAAVASAKRFRNLRF